MKIDGKVIAKERMAEGKHKPVEIDHNHDGMEHMIAFMDAVHERDHSKAHHHLQKYLGMRDQKAEDSSGKGE